MTITSLPLDTLLSSSDSAHFSGRRQLSDISLAVAKCRRAVVISGAGISCSSGIPDFRSADGLYSLVKERYPDAFFTGRDLFSSGLFNNPETTSIFYTFIAELASSCHKAQPTPTHHFISRLANKGKLLRSYTQNVDGLERRLGLESGGRGQGLRKLTTRNVEMHGDLGRVRCVLCMSDYEAKEEWMDMFKQGEAPWCPSCQHRSLSRVSRSARALPIGTLRPAIVLYDEPHPLGEEIGSLQAYDLGRSPDLLLVMGTSLKVHGLKKVVRAFAKAVHAREGGIVVFVNATPPSKEWEGVIDFHVHGTTDAWVQRVEHEWRHLRPQDWETQTLLEGEVVKDLHCISAQPWKHKGTKVPKAAGKGTTAKSSKPRQPKAKKPSPLQLPTPPSSQQSSTTCDSSTFCLSSDGELTPLPPTPDSYRALCSPSTSSPTKRPAAAIPLSPLSDTDTEASPTKKRILAEKSVSPIRPPTGVPSTPGRGNLFGSRTSSSTSDDWEDLGPLTPATGPMSPMSVDDVFFTPLKSPVDALKTKLQTKRRPSTPTAGGKENERPGAVKTSVGGGRQTRSKQLASRRTNQVSL